jgi:hypothetical protein
MLKSIILQSTPNANFMTDYGKIMVVAAVMTVSLIGVLLYLVYLDRKISKIESTSK